MKQFAHGGTIFAAARRLGVEPSEILDLSASINPLGMPPRVMHALRGGLNDIVHYPDTCSADLSETLAEHHGIDASSVLVGNGSTELIYLAMRAVQPASALIPAPTFSEYERAAMISGTCRITYFPLKERGGFRLDANEYIAAMTRIVSSETASAARRAPRPAAFLCNPNNPTGAVTPREDVLRIARAARRLRCYLIVDEAFVDFCPEHSVLDEVRNNPFLVVLRSMTKFYALAGLRLGFGVFPPSVRRKVETMREPWTVNSLAQIAGRAALADHAFRRKSLRLIAGERRFLEQSFRALGIHFIPSSANYYLFRTRNATSVRDSLLRKGILVRNCANFRGLTPAFTRIAVRTRDENIRFLEELTACKA